MKNFAAKPTINPIIIQDRMPMRSSFIKNSEWNDRIIYDSLIKLSVAEKNSRNIPYNFIES